MFDIGSLVSSITGLGVKLGTEIPGLKKPKFDRSAEMGSKRAAAGAQKAIVGASQAGHGASRGLAARSGLRAASQAALEASGSAAEAADKDQARHTLEMNARNKRLKDLGAGIASGLGQVGMSLIRPKDEGEGVAAAQATLQEQPEMAENVTGLEAPNAGMAMAAQDALQEYPVSPEGPTLDSMDADEQAEADEAAGPIAKFQTRTALDEALMTAPMKHAPEIEVQLEERLQMKNLMLQEAERLGINISEVTAGINRKLSLQPGQSKANPMGLSIDMGEE